MSDIYRKFYPVVAVLISIRTVALCTALVWLFFLSPVNASDPTPKTSSATIESITDGDTLVIRIGSKRERIRLIGIDTPESHPNRRAQAQSERSHQDMKTIVSLGLRASDFTRSLLPPGSHVRIEYDVEARDRYGRLLGYVWLGDGRMANETIIRSGYAYPLTVPPNIRYRQRFHEAFSEARGARRGLWSNPVR